MVANLKRWALALALLLLFWPALSTSAQGDVTLTALTIELWPEYDQPSMLVILRGTLAPSVALPATLTLHIPATAGGPSAVAGQDPAGQLFNIPFTATTVGETIAVQFEARQASFQLEYYDPGLVIVGQARDFAFRWPADFSAEAASLRVQEPPAARNLTAEPPISLAGSSDLGVNYYTAALGPIAVGQEVVVHLRYAKSTEALTVNNLNQPIDPPAMSASSPTATSQRLSPQILIGVGLGLLGVGLMGWGAAWLARDWRRSPGRRQQRPRAAVTSELRSAANDSARFCTQCGQPLTVGDRFCCQCGAPVRSTPTE